MRYQLTFQICAILFGCVVLTVPLEAGNILSTQNTARFYDTHSRINFGLPQGDVTVTDTNLTGYAWAEDWGWIHLSPSTAGVVNDGDGNLSGYAWGELTGWINFAPTLGGVTINSDGYFTGYAWAENAGWVAFDCSLISACPVRTTWRAEGEEEEERARPPRGQFYPSPEEDTPPLPPVTEEPPLPPPGEGEPPPFEAVPEDPTDDGDREEDTETPDELEDEPGTSDDPIPGITDPEHPQDPREDTPPARETTIPITERILRSIETLIEHPLSERVSTIAAAFGTIPGLAAIGVLAFLNPIHLSEIGLLSIKLWNIILALFGLKRRRFPWGTVYDSVTKHPLDPAYVELRATETGKEVEGVITDLDGRFGFLPKPGSYTIKVGKTNYSFPSQRLAGRSQDALYEDLYFGGDIHIESENETVIQNIPLDPVEEDWNEIQKRKGSMFSFFSKNDVWFYTIMSTLFYLGFFVAVCASLLFPSIIHTIILAIYIVIFVIRALLGAPRKLGLVADSSGKPLAYAVVRVFIAGTENQVKQVVTNEFGRFYCLVTPASYYVTVSKRVAEELYEKVYTSDIFNAKKGLIDMKFRV